MAERSRSDFEQIGPRVVLVADDLTGAADSGVTFAAHGANVLVVWDTASVNFSCAPFADVDVLVISTESRHGSSQEAARRVRTALEPLGELLCSASPPLLYKKIDSTLRGHPGVELATVLQFLASLSSQVGGGEACSRPRALVAPAFPAQGRITRGGMHYVHGRLLTQTVFGQEVTSSRIQDFFAEDRVGLQFADPETEADPTRWAGASSAWRSGLRFADAETEADLEGLVAGALADDLRVFCGSAGLAHALAGHLGETWGWSASPNVAMAPGASERAILVIAVSRHPQTQRQLERLHATGVPLLTPSLDWILAEGVGDDDALGSALSDALGSALNDALASGVAVLTTLGLPELPIDGAVLVSRLAEGAVLALAMSSRGTGDPSGVFGDGDQFGAERLGLVLTGGDAAIAVSRAWGAQGLRLYGEVAPGIPWGRLVGGPGAGIPVVTKAGGFGDDHTLMMAIDFLQGTHGACEDDGRTRR